jgi:hypothetical protein
MVEIIGSAGFDVPLGLPVGIAVQVIAIDANGRLVTVLQIVSASV